ncbi:glycoside hydrolase superfamily [Chytriomyces sp. MP71]|nr:glycoside hydrolase superfamily [Chytriomyces sp. MP71]
MPQSDHDKLCFKLFWAKVAVALTLSNGGLFYLSWRTYDLHSRASAPSTPNLLPPVAILDRSGKALASCAYRPDSGYARLEPQTPRRMVGFSLDWSYDLPSAIVKKLGGYSPPVFNTFMNFAPGLNGVGFDNASLNWFGSECGKTGSMLELTLQPSAPLSTLTDDMYDTLAQELFNINTYYGVPVFLRYGHEMNGDWTMYGNQPIAFIASFKKMAAAVRAKTNMTAMVWGPNIGITYPFTGAGVSEIPAVGTPDFNLLDTNKDGVINNNDDPYTPFYPGDDVVDWVGLSLYNYPFPNCYNCQVPVTYFNDYLTGQGPVTSMAAPVTPAYTAVHNFYQMFCVTRGKPLMIPETGSPYMPDYANKPGSQDDATVKKQWWSQILTQESMSTFPKLKLAVNFEETKIQSPLGQDVVNNWKVTNTTAQQQMFESLLKGFQSNLLATSDLKFSCDGSVSAM